MRAAPGRRTPSFRRPGQWPARDWAAGAERGGEEQSDCVARGDEQAGEEEAGAGR